MNKLKMSKFLISILLLGIVMISLMLSPLSPWIVSVTGDFLSSVDRVVAIPFNYFAKEKKKVVQLIETYQENETLKGTIYNLEDKANIYMKDILNEEIEEKYDIIYSNPPYLTSDEMGEIPVDVRKEPSLALYGGEDGLEYYRGKLFLEIGYMQKQEVFDIAKENGYNQENISCIKDLENRDRVIILC